MTYENSNLIILGLLLVLSVFSGIWLSRIGRPLNTPLFTLHKLIALAAAILAGVVIYGLQKIIGINAMMVALGLSVIMLFVTGAFLSFEKPLPGSVLTIHRIATIVALLCVMITLFKSR